MILEIEGKGREMIEKVKTIREEKPKLITKEDIDKLRDYLRKDLPDDFSDEYIEESIEEIVELNKFLSTKW